MLAPDTFLTAISMLASPTPVYVYMFIYRAPPQMTTAARLPQMTTAVGHAQLSDHVTLSPVKFVKCRCVTAKEKEKSNYT